MLTRSEVAEHASRESCWIVIRGEAYDASTFLDAHPGGAGIILKYAGKDATKAFEQFHSPDVLQKNLKPEYHLGPAEGDSAQEDSSEGLTPVETKKRLRSIINLEDFEYAAKDLLPAKSFAFLKTGADSENTVRWNKRSWQIVRFRPRVLRPVESIDLSTTIFGTRFSMPFFICPAGGGKLAHPEGEVLLTKAAAQTGVLHWVCNMAGCSKEEMARARSPSQTTYWQIYAMRDLAVTEKEVKQAVALGYKGFALTVDAIRPGKRERDMRLGLDEIEDDDDAERFDIGLSRRAPVTTTFDWVQAIKWLRGLTDLPIAIKGIQCWEDSVLCMEHGVHPWLSNHGGRQLDGAPSAIDTLIEMRKHCPEVFDKCEVIVDGGVTRGTDIVKALALGAKAVGLGRAFLYSLVLGQEGVRRAIRILQSEVETTLALLGVTSVAELNASYVVSAAPQASL
ncbi:hypothetical protein AOCH_000177 [Aspergillus ochraceoroseus]|uniref:Oxidoreductase n=1 Tax=Aspergillus ochraceoroseus TaxID=138278 RepID=A0A0F8UQP7_9EURO|nr:hypothetical protein AOCH_000177 [Aspergillus ochraceoroseus]